MRSFTHFSVDAAETIQKRYGLIIWRLTAALSRIYELKDECDYIMMKSTIIKEFGQDVWQRHKKGVKQLLMFKGTFVYDKNVDFRLKNVDFHFII